MRPFNAPTAFCWIAFFSALTILTLSEHRADSRMALFVQVTAGSLVITTNAAIALLRVRLAKGDKKTKKRLRIYYPASLLAAIVFLLTPLA